MVARSSLSETGPASEARTVGGGTRGPDNEEDCGEEEAGSIMYSFSFSTDMSARSMPGVVLSIEEEAVKEAGAVCSQRI